MTEPIIYVNGEFVPESQARISVLDHAVLYGDGVFETVFARDGRVFKLDAHIERGLRSMRAIALTPPFDSAELKELVLETLRRNRLDTAYVKWVVTRGSNGKPLMDPTGCQPNLIILAQPYINRATPDRIAKGLHLKTVAVRRPPGEVLDPRIKSLNYLNLVLAKLEAKAAGADEALLLDMRGRLCEATGCNIFLLHGDRLLTPKTGILEGVTRETVMELAPALGFKAFEADLELYDAHTADEIVICSTAGGLLPVGRIDGRAVGGARVAFNRLRDAYDALVASDRHGTPIDAARQSQPLTTV